MMTPAVEGFILPLFSLVALESIRLDLLAW
jgi:hypothetical protein